jgi:HK97 family phage major capsid protein
MSKTLEVIKANFDARQAKLTELRSIDEKAVDEKGAPRPYTEDEKAAHDEIRSTVDAIDARIQENLRQELRSAEITDTAGTLFGLLEDRSKGELVDDRTIGERFAGDDEVRSWLAGGARGQGGVYEQDLSFRAVTDVTTGAASGGAFVNNQRLDRVGNSFLDRRTYLLDLLPTIPVSTGSVEYVKDTSPLADVANKAAEVAEGSAKPQAGPTLSVVTEPIATIAAWMNITRQAMADVPQLQGYLDSRLRYSIKRRADLQAISGDGVSPNIAGLSGRSGIVTYAPGGAEARYVSIRHGIRLMEDVESVPEIICLNPADAELFDLSNSTSAGIHASPDAFGGVATAPARTAWGLTQVRSTAIAAGTALLIDPMAVAVLDRQQVSAYLTDSHASNFVSNILTLLLEARLGLALFDPAGVCKITFNGTV